MWKKFLVALLFTGLVGSCITCVNRALKPPPAVEIECTPPPNLLPKAVAVDCHSEPMDGDLVTCCEYRELEKPRCGIVLCQLTCEGPWGLFAPLHCDYSDTTLL